MRPILLFLFLCSMLTVQAGEHPAIPLTGRDTTAFVPKGWFIAFSAAGDLNKDALGDIVLVIQDTDPDNFIKNEYMGADTLDVNPRILLVLFREQDGYRLAAQNRSFIPPASDTGSSCLEDPLASSDALQIDKGLLKVHFQYWYSCGSWYTSQYDYLFRWQEGHFALIGFDSRELHRASGEMNDYSINFSTRKMSHTSGGNMFDETMKPKESWKSIRLPALKTLEQLGADTLEEMQRIAGM